MTGERKTDRGFADCFVRRFGGDGTEVRDVVVREGAVTVMIDGVGSFTVMCTPCDVEAMALGFIFSEGMISSAADVLEVCVKDELPDVVGVVVDDPGRIAVERNLIVASSCGMCGVRNIEKMLDDMPVCGETAKFDVAVLGVVSEKMRLKQRLFEMTGGSHAAGVFDAGGEILSFGEDIGRHNALDKAIGKCLLGGIETAGCGVVLSGRVSLEMVSKAARAGIEVICAVSAPSSFAIEAAKRWNITLCGFVRGGRGNVYTGSERIVDFSGDGK